MNYSYICINCEKEFTANGVVYLCNACSGSNVKELPPKGVLKVVYNYENIKKRYSENNLFHILYDKDIVGLLPIRHTDSLSPLKTGRTPMYAFPSQAVMPEVEHFHLYLKDDSLNPTFSLKDRASNLVSAFARENNIDTIIAASTGNAGSSIAGICASQMQKAIVVVPKSAPKAKLLQIMHYGAEIITVDGTYDDAFEMSIELSEKHGYYNRNTAYNPLTIEGKKTVGFEIYADLDEQLPDFIFVSAGDGVIVSAVFKAFEELMLLGLTDKIPQIITVQSEKSKNIIANLKNDDFKISPATTLADSISVDVPRNFYMTKDYITKYNTGTALVSDDDILEASQLLSQNTGAFTEPASAAAFAGMATYAKKGLIKEGQKAVVLLTGSGLKDLNAIENIHEMPAPLKKI